MNELQELSEAIQQDITFYLDGMDERIIEDICDIIVKRFERDAEIQSVNIAELQHTLTNYFKYNV